MMGQLGVLGVLLVLTSWVASARMTALSTLSHTDVLLPSDVGNVSLMIHGHHGSCLTWSLLSGHSYLVFRPGCDTALLSTKEAKVHAALGQPPTGATTVGLLKGGSDSVTVVLSPVASIELSTTRRFLYRNEPEIVRVIAKDHQGNTFSSLDGAPIRWSILEDDHADAQLVSVDSESADCILCTDRITVLAKLIGRVKLQACYNYKNENQMMCAAVEFRFIENVHILPEVYRLFPGASVHYTSSSGSGEDLKKRDLEWKSSNDSVGTISKHGLFEAQHAGITRVSLWDLRMGLSLSFVDVLVAPISSLQVLINHSPACQDPSVPKPEATETTLMQGIVYPLTLIPLDDQRLPFDPVLADQAMIECSPSVSDVRCDAGDSVLQRSLSARTPASFHLSLHLKKFRGAYGLTSTVPFTVEEPVRLLPRAVVLPLLSTFEVAVQSGQHGIRRLVSTEGSTVDADSTKLVVRSQSTVGQYRISVWSENYVCNRDAVLLEVEDVSSIIADKGPRMAELSERLPVVLSFFDHRGRHFHNTSSISVSFWATSKDSPLRSKAIPAMRISERTWELLPAVSEGRHRVSIRAFESPKGQIEVIYFPSPTLSKLNPLLAPRAHYTWQVHGGPLPFLLSQDKMMVRGTEIQCMSVQEMPIPANVSLVVTLQSIPDAIPYSLHIPGQYRCHPIHHSEHFLSFSQNGDLALQRDVEGRYLTWVDVPIYARARLRDAHDEEFDAVGFDTSSSVLTFGHPGNVHHAIHEQSVAFRVIGGLVVTPASIKVFPSDGCAVQICSTDHRAIEVVSGLPESWSADSNEGGRCSLLKKSHAAGLGFQESTYNVKFVDSMWPSRKIYPSSSLVAHALLSVGLPKKLSLKFQNGNLERHVLQDSQFGIAVTSDIEHCFSIDSANVVFVYDQNILHIDSAHKFAARTPGSTEIYAQMGTITSNKIVVHVLPTSPLGERDIFLWKGHSMLLPIDPGLLKSKCIPSFNVSDPHIVRFVRHSTIEGVAVGRAKVVAVLECPGDIRISSPEVMVTVDDVEEASFLPRGRVFKSGSAIDVVPFIRDAFGDEPFVSGRFVWSPSSCAEGGPGVLLNETVLQLHVSNRSSSVDCHVQFTTTLRGREFVIDKRFSFERVLSGVPRTLYLGTNGSVTFQTNFPVSVYVLHSSQPDCFSFHVEDRTVTIVGGSVPCDQSLRLSLHKSNLSTNAEILTVFQRKPMSFSYRKTSRAAVMLDEEGNILDGLHHLHPVETTLDAGVLRFEGMQFSEYLQPTAALLPEAAGAVHVLETAREPASLEETTVRPPSTLTTIEKLSFWTKTQRPSVPVDLVPAEEPQEWHKTNDPLWFSIGISAVVILSFYVIRFR
eukprot:ANDGO_07875.mRNA.1 nucleoporin